MARKNALGSRAKGLRTAAEETPEEEAAEPETPVFGARAARRKAKLTKRQGKDMRIRTAAKTVAAEKARTNNVMNDKEYN